jgi:hypothetical protein
MWQGEWSSSGQCSAAPGRASDVELKGVAIQLRMDLAERPGNSGESGSYLQE